MTSFPNTFLVGAAKSGTTALTDYLAQHPDVFAWKEPHYFAHDLAPPDHRSQDFDHYKRRFQAAEGKAIRCDASVFYLTSKTAAGDIKAAVPDAKILIQLRNPVDVMESHHSQLLYVEREWIEDFETALGAESDRKAGLRDAGKPWAELRYYRDFVRFSEQVERYFDTFGRDRVRVSIFDDFKADTRAVYRDTLEFLEIDPEFEPDIRVVNANKKLRSRLAMQLLVRNPPAWLSMPARMLFPLETRNRIKSLIRRANTRYVPRQGMRPELRAQLTEELRPEVSRLSQLLDRDLSHWSEIRTSRQAA